MAIKEDYPEKYGWWISELNSLGVNTGGKDEDIQALEDLTDNTKQNFIHEYKNRYSKEVALQLCREGFSR